MKIIHTADLHFDSKMETYLSKEKARERKVEIRLTFQKMVEYAKENGVKVIIICGDMFDSKNVTQATKNFIYETFKSNPNIDFLVLKGNHDEFELSNNDIPNLKLFSNEFLYYNYDNVTITGLNLNGGYYPNTFDLLSLNKDKFNILCLHGRVCGTYNFNVDYCIPLNALSGKNINYVALGHIHNHYADSLQDGTIYAYPGILEPRGFDECGEKGFIEIEINEKVDYKFIPFSKRQFHHIKCDVSSCKTASDILNVINNNINSISKDNLIKVELLGEVDIELNKDLDYISKVLNEKFYFAKVIDNTRVKIDYEKLKYDISFKGEFIRTVDGAKGIDDYQKSKIIEYGIKALNKGEI